MAEESLFLRALADGLAQKDDGLAQKDTGQTLRGTDIQGTRLGQCMMERDTMTGKMMPQ